MFRDRVEQITKTSGTGVYTLDSSVTGKRQFTASGCFVNNDKVIYTVVQGAAWECNLGTLNTVPSPAQLSRDRLIASSTGSPINWPDSTDKQIFNDVPAEILGPMGWQYIGGVLAGTVDAITFATVIPTPVFVDGMTVLVDLAGANTVTTPSFALNGLAAKTIVLPSGGALAVGDLQAGRTLLSYKLSTDKWIFLGRPNSTGTFSGTLTSIAAGAGAGPDYIADRNKSAANNDLIGRFVFRGRNASAAAKDYAYLVGKLLDITAGSEDGALLVQALVNGADTAIATFGPGLQLGAPTGGDKGLGTVNATGLFINGVGVQGAFLHCRDEKTSGTDAGGFTSGAFQTRVLNTKVVDEIGVTLSSNQVQGLPAGTYYCEAEAPAFQVNGHKLKLRNITDGADIPNLIGIAGDDGTSGISGMSVLRGQFTIAATKTIELQHRCTVTKATDGLGQNCAFGVVEVYADLKIWRKSA